MEQQPEGPSPVCAIEVEFHARHGEIDLSALDRVLNFVESAPGIAKAYDERRGHGEPDALCLVIDRPSDALAIYERLTLLVPAQSRRVSRMKPRPPVILHFNGG